MELLFSDLPNEVIDIITNNIRKINLLTYFHKCSFDLLSMIKKSNCVLTVNFTDNHQLITDSFTVYGAGDSASKHPFDRNICSIKVPYDYEKEGIFKRSSTTLENPRYYRLKSVCNCSVCCTKTILEIKFWIINKLQSYIELIDDKNILII